MCKDNITQNTLYFLKKSFCMFSAFSALFFLLMNVSFVLGVSRNLEVWLKFSAVFLLLIFPLAVLKNHLTHKGLFVISQQAKTKLQKIYKASGYYAALTMIASLCLCFLESDFFEATESVFLPTFYSGMWLYLSIFVFLSIMLGRTNRKINF